MVLEPPCGTTGCQIPEAESFVPGAGQSVVSVGRENYVAHEMGVSMKPLLGDPVVGVVPVQFPNNQSLVSGTGQDHLRILRIGGDLCDPTIVSSEGASKLQSFRHFRKLPIKLGKNDGFRG